MTAPAAAAVEAFNTSRRVARKGTGALPEGVEWDGYSGQSKPGRDRFASVWSAANRFLRRCFLDWFVPLWSDRIESQVQCHPVLPRAFMIHDHDPHLQFALETSRRMLHMFVDDLTPEQRLYRICPEANCVDWVVGHLVLTEQRFHAVFGAASTPLPEGFDKLFARDETAPRQVSYGDTSNLMKLFDQQRDITINRVCELKEEELIVPLTNPHPRFSTLGEAAQFCALHTTLHAGQFSMIRRMLGKPPVV
jgi:uncharacterized damage-inducible protein DinB